MFIKISKDGRVEESEGRLEEASREKLARKNWVETVLK
jgi:hypothetical protein